jgi:ATP/maltotriose-dependent transcriptional regulator MalT
MELAGYRIDAVIGQGGMGTVYRAEQLRLRRNVALKIMAPDLASDPTFRERFLRESQVAATLEHPHVVSVFDAGDLDGVLYIAMRYVQGCDLRALIRREHGISPDVAVSVLEQVASGLDAAHALGLVHRDVKPSNVLIADARGPDDPVQSYLTDFGLSKSAEHVSGGTTGRPLGSARYMSPEQIRGERVDGRSDIYSLACLLYECLAGEVPFVRDSEAAVLYAHLEAPSPRVSDAVGGLPAVLDDVIAWALAKSPADRPGTSGEFAAAVADALSGSPSWQRPVPRKVPVAIEPSGSGRREARPIVGRLREQAQLLAALEETAAGRGSVVLLVGEAGIGKSTLAHWLSEEAERRGVPAVSGVGGAFGEAPPPYWHWVQVVRVLARRPDASELFARLGDAAAWLVPIAPDIAIALPDVEFAPTPMGADEGRFHVYDALAQLLASAADGSGLVIVLDDLHLADEASLLALGFIAGLIRDAGVLVVGTYREEDLARARSERDATSFAELSRSSRNIPLGGLHAEHVGRLIAARTGGEVPNGLIERVHTVTAGNPLFVSELLNLLEAQGKLTDSQIASSALPLPTGISDAISQRLAPLPRRGREVLDVGAVIGASFRASTLARAARIPPEEVLELLDQASQRGLVRPVADLADGYAFSHGLVQTAVYEALPRARRCALHAPVGEALEHDYDVAAGEGLAEIAYHFLEAAPAGGKQRAVECARRAAERAVRTFAYDQAITLYTRALEIADASRGRERIELLQALGEAQMRAGDTDAARATLQRAAETARAHDDPEGLARASLASGIWGLSLGIDEPLLRLAEEAVEQLEGGHSPGLLACVKAQLATALYYSKEVERRKRLAADSLTLARAMHERERTAESARTLGYVLSRYLLTRWGPQSAEEDFGLSDELLEVCREARDAELEILTRNWRIAVLLEVGSFAAVDQEIIRVEQMATELRQPRAMVFLPLHHATRAATAGRFAQAERQNAESMEIGLGVHGTVGELAGRAQLISIRLQQGRLAELEGPVTGLANAHPGLIAMQCVRVLILAQSGRHAEAAAGLERLTRSGLAELPEDHAHIVALALLGEVVAELEDQARARLLYAWLEPYAGRWVVSPGAAALWPVDRSLARLATVAGSPHAARRHIVRAREQAARAGALPSVALVALDEARLLAAAGRPDDGARISALAREARELAQELGMGLVLDAATLIEARQS